MRRVSVEARVRRHAQRVHRLHHQYSRRSKAAERKPHELDDLAAPEVLDQMPGEDPAQRSLGALTEEMQHIVVDSFEPEAAAPGDH